MLQFQHSNRVNDIVENWLKNKNAFLVVLESARTADDTDDYNRILLECVDEIDAASDSVISVVCVHNYLDANKHELVNLQSKRLAEIEHEIDFLDSVVNELEERVYITKVMEETIAILEEAIDILHYIHTVIRMMVKE